MYLGPNSLNVAASKVDLAEGAAPSTPPSTEVIVYAKDDGLVYSKDDAGAETLMSGGSSASPGWELVAAAVFSGTGDKSLDIPANTLTVDGEHLLIETTMVPSGGTVTPTISFGGNDQLAGGTVSNGINSIYWLRVYRTGASAQDIFLNQKTYIGASNAATTRFSAETVSHSSAITVALGNSGSNSITWRSLKIWKVGV